MKLHPHLLPLAAALVLGGRAFALPIPSDGSDGNFAPGSNIEVDLGQAITGTWSDNNSANAGKGIYDPVKWAVVFKYASVNIPAGVTVTFKNNASRAPVVWLVQGNVNIAGKVRLNGANITDDQILRLAPTEPGPGGFRGGPLGPTGNGAGFGPGGGNSSTGVAGNGLYNIAYGNPQVIPLIGGSGGGASSLQSFSGAASGGAILIAAAGVVQVGGAVSANGGSAASGAYPRAGSGGAVRILGEQVIGSGVIQAAGGATSNPGRIRIETSLLSTALQINPSTIAVRPPATPVIWPAANAPEARIVSVDGVLAPADPTAPLLSSADVGIQKNLNVDVFIQTTNFSTAGNVRLRVGPKYGNFSLVTCTYVSGTFASATWKATLAFNPGFSALQAIATTP
jgi:plastocyanin